MAVSGLNQDAVGLVRLSLDQGLIGLVGRREEPINLDDAPSHADFFQDSIVGEEELKAFLGCANYSSAPFIWSFNTSTRRAASV